MAEAMHAYGCQRAWRTSAAAQCKKCLDMKGQDSKKTLGQAQTKSKTQGAAWGEVLKYRNNWSGGMSPSCAVAQSKANTFVPSLAQICLWHKPLCLDPPF